MTFGKSIYYPENVTGIRHTMIRQNGKTIGWETEYLTSPTPTPLTKLQIQRYQRQLYSETHAKNWEDLIRNIKEDDLINQRLEEQAEQLKLVDKHNKALKELPQKTVKPRTKKQKNWQKPLSPWIVLWNKDVELRKLFDNNYRHMRCVANKKNYTRDWVHKLKEEERKKNKTIFVQPYP